MTKQVEKQALVAISEMVFEEKNFNIYGTFENPLFLAKDVAEWIDYSKNADGSYKISMMIKKVDDDEKLMSTLLMAGQNREMWFLTEHGVYELLMQSRKPIAKEVKKTIKAHMKEIRTKGVSLHNGLSIEQQSEVLLSKLDELLHQQEEELALLTQQVEELGEQAFLLEEEIESIDQQIAELQPYAEKYKEFLSEDALMTIDDFARIMHPRYHLGRNKLFQLMREKRMLGSQERSYNMPHRQLVRRGILTPIKGQVFITKKGFDYLCDALDAHFGL